jgi:hypothetical protein
VSQLGVGQIHAGLTGEALLTRPRNFDLARRREGDQTYGAAFGEQLDPVESGVRLDAQRRGFHD